VYLLFDVIKVIFQNGLKILITVVNYERICNRIVFQALNNDTNDLKKKRKKFEGKEGTGFEMNKIVAARK
jgi:hypothetical protein